MKPAHYPDAPAHIWEHFYRITQIPRRSGEEAAVREYVIKQAELCSYRWHCDKAGNLIVYVPGSRGRERECAVIIQNHLDMVTVKTEDKNHNFGSDPLELRIEDGWLKADRTTLGADNGIGCAAALALITDNSVVHPPLELLFTVEEETGLGGAANLEVNLLSGTRMLNLDTEEWNELFIGCAGGSGHRFWADYSTTSNAGLAHFRLSLSGLAGGHSGIQIHEQLGNAIKLLGEFLQGINGVQLSRFQSGVAHNVIPREGEVWFACRQETVELLQTRIDNLVTQWLAYLPCADHGLCVTLNAATAEPVICVEESALILDLLALFPHGALSYNLDTSARLVDLSCNLARCELANGRLFIESSLRFFNYFQSLQLRHQMSSLARMSGLELIDDGGYPGWQPDFDSCLLAQAKKLHERNFGVKPEVKAIHAGLECGILKSKMPDIDILSFGPTIRGAHSPAERLQINTVAPFWTLLTALLAEI